MLSFFSPSLFRLLFVCLLLPISLYSLEPVKLNSNLPVSITTAPLVPWNDTLQYDVHSFLIKVDQNMALLRLEGCEFPPSLARPNPLSACSDR